MWPIPLPSFKVLTAVGVLFLAAAPSFYLLGQYLGAKDRAKAAEERLDVTYKELQQCQTDLQQARDDIETMVDESDRRLALAAQQTAAAQREADRLRARARRILDSPPVSEDLCVSASTRIRETLAEERGVIDEILDGVQ